MNFMNMNLTVNQKKISIVKNLPTWLIITVMKVALN